MQGKAPCHAMKSFKGFLSNQSIAALYWPSKPTNINPIEGVWSVFKQKVYNR